MSDLVHAAREEIVRRHAFFVAWFTGKANAAAFEASSKAFSEDFRMLWPDMVMDTRETLLNKLWEERCSKPEDYAIRIAFIHAASIDTDTALVVCDEHQTTDDGGNSRRMSAIFSRDRAAPHGVVWRHLHQSWLPD